MQMRAYRIVPFFAASLIAGGVTFAQVGRGWSDWPTPYADAQRTSWMQSDPNISVASLSKPGFELQWTSKLDSQRRGPNGLTQGVTFSGVTLFVPASLVAGSSNKLYMLDNDTGYVVWTRTFEGTLPAPTGACSGGITAAPTRIVSGAATPATAAAAAPPARGNQQGYRSLLGEPGQGIPVEPRGGGPPRGAPVGPARQGGAPGPAVQGRGEGGGIPGAPNVAIGAGTTRVQVGYAVSADGQLRVVGLQSGKDLQKPAPFLPPNSQWSNPVAVGTMMYAATSGNCAGAPNGVYAIDLDAPDKPVVSYRTNGGSVVGAVAFSSDGNTLLAAIGPGSATGNGKANAIVALDPRTLQLKDWFSQPASEFVTGPTVFQHGTKDVVAAATKDGRVILLDVASLGGADHAKPLAASPPLFASGGSISAEALSTWARAAAATTGPADSAARPSTSLGTALSNVEGRWVLVPVSGRPVAARTTNGAIRNGAVVALRVKEVNGTFSLEPEWTSTDLTSPATPIIVNGVVFALSAGRAAAAGRTGSPAVLVAHDGLSGKTIWNSGKSMTASASPGSFWSGLSQVYVGAEDGTVYAFGFLDERR
jgi:outer membrane protein assembly factor BamB